VVPQTHYARSGDSNIAYQVFGDGPLDMLFGSGPLSNVEHLWEEPGVARLFERFARFARVILMDRRGTGLSDPFDRPMTLAEEVEDVNLVLDAVGSERPAIFGYGAAAPYTIMFAHKHPERARALVLYGGFARARQADDMPWGQTAEERTARIDELLERWGEGSNLEAMAPSAANDERLRSWLARMERLSGSPGAMRAVFRALGEADVRDLLPTLRVPTLVLHRTGDQLIDVRHSRYMAERIPGATYVELPGDDSLPMVGDVEALVGEVEEFLTGGRAGRTPERALLTVLFTDICNGTARAAELGDGRWRDLLSAHDTAVRAQLAAHGGQEVKTIGDGFLAVFEGPPSSAVRCARAIVGAASRLGVEVRTGLHTGECELLGDDIGGMAVHIAARVGALAGPGEVWASGTTFGTVVGSGLDWESLGAQELKGVPGSWPIFRLNR
jgi:class 3 adenylate cyclase